MIFDWIFKIRKKQSEQAKDSHYTSEILENR